MDLNYLSTYLSIYKKLHGNKRNSLIVSDHGRQNAGVHVTSTVLKCSHIKRGLTLAGSVKTGREGLALCSNSASIFMRFWASMALTRRLFELSSWSPRWTTLVATYVMRSSNPWNSLKASYNWKRSKQQPLNLATTLHVHSCCNPIPEQDVQ